MQNTLKFIVFPLLAFLINACDNTPSVQYGITPVSDTQACFMETGIMVFQNDMPISGVTTNQFNCVKNLANNGDQQAQWFLVNFYKNGITVRPSPTMQTYWLKKLEAGGDKEARNLLAMSYHKGIGVQKDTQKALELLEKSHSDNEIIDFSAYSYILLTSDNHKENWPIAKKLLTQSIQRNEKWAYHYLPHIYLNNIYMPRDIDRAITYFEEGISLGLTHYNVWLGLIYLSGTGVTKDYEMAEKYFEASDYSEIYNLILKDLQHHKTKPEDYIPHDQNPTVSFRIAMLYEADQDYKNAYHYYKKAALKNHFLAYKKMEELITNQLIEETSINLNKLSKVIENSKQDFLREIYLTQSFIMLLKAFKDAEDTIANQVLNYYEEAINSTSEI